MANSIFVCCHAGAISKDCAKAETELRGLGEARRVFPCCWYLQSTLSPSEISARVSRALDPEASLFVIDATNHEAAWKNIGSEAAEFIKTNWGQDGVPSFNAGIKGSKSSSGRPQA